MMELIGGMLVERVGVSMLGARGQTPLCNHPDAVGKGICHFSGYPLPFILEFAVA